MFSTSLMNVGLTVVYLSATISAKILYAGVNSAGGEFAQQNLPGVFGTDYQFINQSAIDFFINAGVNTIRLPFLLERMCPLQTGLGSTFNETYFSEYETAVNYVTMRGGYALIDPHNYYRYNDPSSQPSSGSIIGNTTDPKASTTAEFATFWGELAKRFVTNPNVILGLMNEPHDMPTELILSNNQASMDSIRQAGAEQLILVPGNGFTGAQKWLNSTCSGCKPSADVLTAIKDPSNNFAFDMHLYFDNDTSGTHNECTTAAPGNIAATTTWLQENNYTAFLSEFGAGANSVCFQTVNDTISWLESHPQFIGWTYWAAGPIWGDYFLSIEPGVGPQSNSTWPQVLQPHVSSYAPMQKCGVSTNGLGGLFTDVERELEGCLGLKLVGL